MSGPIAVERVLQVHTRYRQPGGEDEVVAAERGLLAEAGLSVTQLIFENPKPQGRRLSLPPLTQSVGAIWSRAAARRVREEIEKGRPQVVHVHNTVVAASPSVYEAARSCGIPVVQTLHNYRFFCPAGTAYRDGRPCTDCLASRTVWPAVAHACYRGSRLQSGVVAATLAIHKARGTYARSIAVYVALTRFQGDLLVRAGLPADRMRVLPNFLEPDPGIIDGARSGFVFIGRLASDKGLPALVSASVQVPGVIRIAGQGPLEPLVAEAASNGQLEAIGQVDKARIFEELRRSSAMVLPSIWYEGLPVSLLEAFATGTPVIASRIGSLAEIVEDGVTGLHVRPGDAEDLAMRLRWANEHPDEMRQMGANARRRYEQEYRGQRHLAGLLDTYRQAVEMRSAANG